MRNFTHPTNAHPTGLREPTLPGWRLDDAEAILRLRALKVSGDLEAYLGFHFQQDRRRNHPQLPIPTSVGVAA